MLPALESKLQRFRDLEAQLADPDVAADPAKFGKVAKEHAGLNKVVGPYLQW